MEKEGTVYLAQLNVFGYELTSIGRTWDEARQAIKDEYEKVCKRLDARGQHGPLDDHGRPREFDDYAEYACLNIHDMPFGKVEWL